VDDERRMLGIITHDDVIDVVREEATEDAHRIAGVDPLEESYLKTRLFTLTWKRGLWLTILFFAALITAFALRHFDNRLQEWVWLAWFLPLVISSGGNSGNQSATLIITALAVGDITLGDWWRVVSRELWMGLLLGGFLGLIGFFAALWLVPMDDPSLFSAGRLVAALTIPATLILVVVCGTLCGSLLPLLFQRLGLDPALMSNPFVAGIIDILGIVIYMNVAAGLLALA
jgi:magnesium transporter